MNTLVSTLHYLRTVLLATIFTSLLLFASSENVLSAEVASNKVILDAKVLSYDQLPLKELNKYGCCTYSKSNGTTMPDRIHFDIEDAYFVQATIDPSALARVLLLNSCEGEALTWGRQCSRDRLEEKVQELFSYSNPYMFYGKYMNQWSFSNENGVIPSTTKFTGHDILSLDQNELLQHSLIIGPLPQKPVQMRIYPYNSLEGGDKYSADLEVSLIVK